MRRSNVSLIAKAGFAASVLVWSSITSAQNACDKPKQAGGSMTEGTYRILERANKKLVDDKYADAQAELQKLAERTRGYEKAVVLQTLGYAYSLQNKMPPALKAFEEALALDSLPQDPQENLLYNVGQMYVADSQYDKGIERLTTYLATACKAPPPEAHILLASAYAEKKQFSKALPQVDQAIAKAKKPNESWLQLKLAIHYELKQFSKCAEVLVTLIGMSPKKEDYWKQLSGILFEVKRDQESLAVLALSERQGFLKKESDYRNLANVYMLLEIPYKAGKLFSEAMDKGIVEKNGKNYQFLSDAWVVAREWDEAEKSLIKTAQLTGSGDTWKRLGQVYLEQERWSDAVNALQKAIDAGVSRKGETNLLIGVASFSDGKVAQAEKALIAAQADPQVRAQAQQWLSHIRSESAAEE